MRKLALFFLTGVWMSAMLSGQVTFEELVDRAFGSDQVLVNGIQFSNQYIRIEGNPYFMDGRFHMGSVFIGDQLYEQLSLRYNQYTQRVEIEHRNPRGHLNMVITVPEQMPAFYLDGYEFRRMQLGKDEPMYYMVLSSEKSSCYIGSAREVLGGGSYEQSFSEPQRKCWMKRGTQWITFDDRKSYIRAFPPERKREFKALLKSERFIFKAATTTELVEMIRETMRLLDKEEGL